MMSGKSGILHIYFEAHRYRSQIFYRKQPNVEKQLFPLINILLLFIYDLYNHHKPSVYQQFALIKPKNISAKSQAANVFNTN